MSRPPRPNAHYGTARSRSRWRRTALSSWRRLLALLRRIGGRHQGSGVRAFPMDHIRCLAYFLILLLLHCSLSGCRKDGPVSIRLGMKMDTVMSSLAADGIRAKQNEGQYALPGDPPSKRFIIRSPASPDALYLYFSERGQDPAYRLE